MSVLVWVHDHVWWLLLFVVPCAVALTWALWAGWYEPQHAGRPEPVRERWVPWETDPRFGSMQLADDLAWPAPPDAHCWREVAHEWNWRDETAVALAPAVLDSGPGVSLAFTSGPDLEPPGLGLWSATSGGMQAPSLPAPVELEVTWAGRVVESSDEWLRRLVRDAAPGWTYAAA